MKQKAVDKQLINQLSDRKNPIEIKDIRQKYAINREAFTPLQELFKDAPPAKELTSHLSK